MHPVYCKTTKPKPEKSDIELRPFHFCHAHAHASGGGGYSTWIQYRKFELYKTSAQDEKSKSPLLRHVMPRKSPSNHDKAPHGGYWGYTLTTALRVTERLESLVHCLVRTSRVLLAAHVGCMALRLLCFARYRCVWRWQLPAHTLQQIAQK